MPEHVEQVVEWYRSKARPFLAKLEAEKVIEFDKDCARLEAAAAFLDEELPVCFLGNSGVGKKHADQRPSGGGGHLVPSGGVGPLTAQALTVRYGAEPKFQGRVFPGPEVVEFGIWSGERVQGSTRDTKAANRCAAPRRGRSARTRGASGRQWHSR